MGHSDYRNTPPEVSRLLRVILCATGIQWIVCFIFMTLITVRPIIPMSSPAGRLLMWGHGGVEYLVMLAAVNIALSIGLLLAARDPYRYGRLVDAFLLTETFHMASMLVMGFLPGQHIHLIGDIPLGIVSVAIVAAIWLPARAKYVHYEAR